ncbi:MAG: hypothetical protein ACRBN8_34500 [Nannocystales bacterium]
MFRIGFGVACIALVGAMVGCTTDVEDPGFTASNGAETTDSPGTDTAGSSSGEDPSGTSVNPTTGDSGSSGDPSGTTTSGAASSTSTSGDPTTATEGGGCGDGVVSPGEQCDGADLQGLDCTALGLGTGTLGCDPMMCTFDTSMCMSDSGGTSG